VVCDNEFVDQDGNAQACLDALTAWTAAIQFSSSGSATSSCHDNVCEASAEGEASCNCSVPRRSNGQPWGLFVAAGALGLGFARRRLS
jgi:MYXO-CTERM domain-containing protein